MGVLIGAAWRLHWFDLFSGCLAVMLPLLQQLVLIIMKLLLVILGLIGEATACGMGNYGLNASVISVRICWSITNSVELLRKGLILSLCVKRLSASA